MVATYPSQVSPGSRQNQGTHQILLSFGEKQRVAIARSLINNPGLVLADEPTGNLDRETSQEVIRLTKELCLEKGVACIVATHDQTILWAADRVVELPAQLANERSSKCD